MQIINFWAWPLKVQKELNYKHFAQFITFAYISILSEWRLVIAFQTKQTEIFVDRKNNKNCMNTSSVKIKK